MSKETIKKEKLHEAFLMGAKAVINFEDHLNEINVFPVKDSDTGSNVASLMRAILESSKIESTLKATLDSISNAALIGSRGNSGIIFSQFFYGLSKDIKKDDIDLETLIIQLENGYKEAYDAIIEPVEGTIITIMRKWVSILKKYLLNKKDIKETLIESNKELKVELEKTKNELKVLKDNNVVDAGAKAFIIFVDGFVNSVVNNSYELERNETKLKIDANHNEHNSLEDIKYRYCTEVLIKTKLDKDAIYHLIKTFGDSIAIGKSSDYYKIHLHTNQPADFIETVVGFANIIESKVEDMVNQYRLNNEELKEICILTDSIADLPLPIIDQQNIQVLPISIALNKMYYFDKLTVDNKKIIKLINEYEEFPKTASPSMLSVKKVLENLKKYYKKIIVITVSSKMSSTYNVFQNVSKQLKDENIIIIDSYQNSVSEGLLVLKASQLVENNYSFDQIINKITKTIPKTKILVHVNSLDNMVKGGRIKKGLGFIAKIIRLKPIISIDEEGEGNIFSKSIGNRNNIKKIINHLKKTHEKFGIESYAITHVNNIKLAEEIKTKLIKELKIKPAYITESSSVIALNAGDKAVAVAYTRKDN